MVLLIIWLIVLSVIFAVSLFSSIKKEQTFIGIVMTNITIAVIALKMFMS